jgi:hypothetical protein
MNNRGKVFLIASVILSTAFTSVVHAQQKSPANLAE